MSKKLLALALVASVAATMAGPVQAQFRDPQAAVKYRTSVMTLLGAHFGRLAPIAKKEAPFDQATVMANVDVIKMLSDLPWGAYAKGYEGGDARGDIWSDNEGFQKAASNFKVAVEQLDKAAQAGDFDAFRVAFGQVGQSCKSCHDSYRVKK